MEHSSEDIKYPPEARNQRITGKVVLQLRVAEDGSLEDVIVAVPVHPALDAEARGVYAAGNGAWHPFAVHRPHAHLL